MKQLDFMNGTPETVIHNDLPIDYDSDMEVFLNTLGLTLIVVETFFTPPNGGKVPIHTDYTTHNTDFVKINKTWGPEDGHIVWWDCSETFEYELSPKMIDEKGVKVQYDASSTITSAFEENCKKLHSANTNKLSLVNTGCLHSTINPSNEPRWTICHIPAYLDKVATRKNWYDACVKWDDALEIFKDYLE